MHLAAQRGHLAVVEHMVGARGVEASSVGGEGMGIRRLVREHCDFIVTIPMGRNEIGSLNASVAAGLVLYEVFRQRHAS